MGLPKAYHDQSAQQMLLKVLQPWIDLLRNDFEHGFQEIQRYDDMTFRQYLRSVVSLPHDVIDYIELIMSQTNQYDLSFTDLMMQTLHFNTPEWVTVKGGMSRMVDEAARLLGSACFRNAAVTEIVETDDGKVSLSVQGISTVRKQSFDKVILAISPTSINEICTRPQWPYLKEQAIRSIHEGPLYKMGLHFRTRFWEHTSEATMD